MIDYLDVIAVDTETLAGAVEVAGPDAAVPSCPEWTAADLCDHLRGVQVFWSQIVEERRKGPEGVIESPRPPDHELPGALRSSGRRLVEALRPMDPETPVWTWADDQTAAWVMRRQAHEALIHRVDGELAAGRVPHVSSELAADGVQELVDWFFGHAPAWATFEPRSLVRLEQTDGPGAWYLSKGRFRGTGPDSGTAYDMDTVLAGTPGKPDTVVRGTAAQMDLWLWGREDISALEVTGDRALAEFVRQEAMGVMQ